MRGCCFQQAIRKGLPEGLYRKWQNQVTEPELKTRKTLWTQCPTLIALSFFFYYYYLFISAAPGLSCGMRNLSCDMGELVPWPRMEPRPPALGSWRLSHYTTREVPPPPHFIILYSDKSQGYPSSSAAALTWSPLWLHVGRCSLWDNVSKELGNQHPVSLLFWWASLRPVHEQLPEDWTRSPTSVGHQGHASFNNTLHLPPSLLYLPVLPTPWTHWHWNPYLRM